MKVQATQLGYYEHKRRREGDVFELVERKDRHGKVMTVNQQFSSKWMKKVSDDTEKSESVMTRIDSSNLEKHQTANQPVHSDLSEVKAAKKGKSSGDKEVI